MILLEQLSLFGFILIELVLLRLKLFYLGGQLLISYLQLLNGSLLLNKLCLQPEKLLLELLIFLAKCSVRLRLVKLKFDNILDGGVIFKLLDLLLVILDLLLKHGYLRGTGNRLSRSLVGWSLPGVLLTLLLILIVIIVLIAIILWVLSL